MKPFSHEISPQCLSHYRLARLACKQLAPTPEDEAHMKTCEACADVLREQSASVAATALEPVPDYMHAPMPATRGWFNLQLPAWAWMLSTAVLLAVLLPAVLTSTQNDPLSHVKGNATLFVTVLRGEQIIADDVPVDSVPQVQAGDRLRLHVPGTAGKYAQVSICSSLKTCEVSYLGPPEAGGWIPGALRIDDSSPSTLKVLICEDASMQSCQTLTYAR